MTTYNACGLDVAFDNAVFAALEVDYTEADADVTGAPAGEVEARSVTTSSTSA